MSAERAREMEEDALLVARAQRGDKAAFGKLMERYQQRAFAVAFGMLRQRDDALDVVQDAFLKAHRNLEGFQGQASFYTWLYRIVVNLCIDARRKRSRSRTEPLELEFKADVDNAAALGASPHRPGAQPAANAENRQLAAQIARGLEELSEAHRDILILREVDGLSYEELAEVLGISKGTVMSRLFHARRNMQRQLRPALGLQEGQGLDGRPMGDPPKSGGED